LTTVGKEIEQQAKSNKKQVISKEQWTASG
jgi:hypothetical protein